MNFNGQQTLRYKKYFILGKARYFDMRLSALEAFEYTKIYDDEETFLKAKLWRKNQILDSITIKLQ